MKCWRSSTIWLGSVAIVLAAWPSMGAEPPVEEAARAAIVSAVQARLGAQVIVEVEALDVRVAGATAVELMAMPDPNGRLNLPMRFGLLAYDSDDPGAAPRRVGAAEAVVRVAMPHAIVTVSIGTGTTLTEHEVASVDDYLGEVPLERLPRMEETIGARARRPLAPGEVLTYRVLIVPPLVRSGETVVTRAVIGSIEARGRAVAAQRGRLGDVIRLVNPASGRTLKGRVIARGQVEVMHEP